MNKRYFLSIILSLAFAFSASGKEFLTVEKILKRAQLATLEKYPDSDQVLIDDFIQVQYQADGTSETWDDTALKVLTEKGKRANRTLSLHFDTAYGTNYFSTVQILKADGRIIEIDAEMQSKVMVDPSQMSANIYNPNSKILQLSVPGLEIGDTLRYIAHKIETKTVIPNVWSDYQVFEHTSPIERTTYQVIAPKERPLKNIALKADIPGTVGFSKLESEQSDKIVYTWEVRDVPRMFDEPNMPTRHTVTQRLLVSTMETWEDLSRWYWDLCLPRLDSTTPEMITMAQELAAVSTNRLDKIKAIFNFVSQDIRYMGITTEDEAPGYEPHDVSITFSNRYGVCRDKAALLASMLRIVDIEAFPVIIMAGPKKDEEVPQPMFNHAVTAALDDNGEYILMDSTDENTKDIFPSYLQNMSYIVARPEGETLLTSPIIPAADNLLKIRTTGTLNEDGNLSANSTLVFEGINDTVYRGYFSKIKPEERKRFFEGHLKKSMPTAELQNLKIRPTELRNTSEPLSVSLSYTAEDLLIKGAEASILNLPRLGSSLGYANFLIGQTGLDVRKYPLYTRMTAGIQETLEMEMPRNAGTPQIPTYLNIENPQLSWNMQIGQDEKYLTTTNTFLLNAVEFSSENYLALKQNLKDIEYNLRKKLILNTSPEENTADSDVRILEKTNEIYLEDASHWKEFIQTKIEILTYSGKKKNSEIKIPYNPAWQNIELTKATVTHPDGTVKTISAEELNLMDASWVASAPRYPAEKLLVANLPGVEIGSIIEYVVVSSVNGKPFFSTTQTFNGHEPIDKKTVKLTAPKELNLTFENTGIPETKTTSDDAITYTWTAENQIPVKQEENLPSWWTFNPTLFISSSSWESYGSNVLSHLVAATQNQPETKALSAQLTQTPSGRPDQVIALRDWVAKNIRPAGPGLTSLPLSAITPSDLTLKERYGNNSDRMVVLYTLLKAAKFNPDFVLTGNISLIPEAAKPLLDTPSRTAFNTVLIKLNIRDEIIYLNGSSQYAELGTSIFQYRPSLNLNSGKIETVEVALRKGNRTRTTYDISITSEGQAGLTLNESIEGPAFESFHKMYAEITPEQRRRHYLEIVSAFSQSAKATSPLITDYSTYPGKQEFSAAAPRYAVQDGEYLYFTIPGGLGGLLKYRSNERENPLAWNTHIDTIIKHNITLPAGYEPVIIPQNYSWQAPANGGLVEVAVKYNPKKNTIRIIQLADLKPALIPANTFSNIIEASRKLAHPDMRTILLRKKKTP
jgi:transglutaminase-like putative cysteine protease